MTADQPLLDGQPDKVHELHYQLATVFESAETVFAMATDWLLYIELNAAFSLNLTNLNIKKIFKVT